MRHLGLLARTFHDNWLENQVFDEIQFDDLETIEHTKLKPVTVPVVISKDRKILGFEVARIPAKGHLAKRSIKKYGFRKNEAPQARDRLFAKLTPNIHPCAHFECDQHPHYPEIIQKHYPQSNWQQYKGKKSAVSGQGELKKGKFDPLFKINHTFAMFRANINRLIRKTWNTTKLIEALENHIILYVILHNMVLTNKEMSKKKALRKLFYLLSA